jgi:hypothetical protein
VEHHGRPALANAALTATTRFPGDTRTMIITHAQLREVFVSAQLKHYFDKKLAPLPGDEVDIRIEETLKFLNMATYITGNIPVERDRRALALLDSGNTRVPQAVPETARRQVSAPHLE